MRQLHEQQYRTLLLAGEWQAAYSRLLHPGYLADLTRFATCFEQANSNELTPLPLTPTSFAPLLVTGAPGQAGNYQPTAGRNPGLFKVGQDSSQISNDPTRGIRPIQMQKLASK